LETLLNLAVIRPPTVEDEDDDEDEDGKKELTI
jgi:hypothetical protein